MYCLVLCSGLHIPSGFMCSGMLVLSFFMFYYASTIWFCVLICMHCLVVWLCVLVCKHCLFYALSNFVFCYTTTIWFCVLKYYAVLFSSMLVFSGSDLFYVLYYMCAQVLCCNILSSICMVVSSSMQVLFRSMFSYASAVWFCVQICKYCCSQCSRNQVWNVNIFLF